MSAKIIIYSLLLISSFNFIKSYLKFNIPSNDDKCYGEEIFIEGNLLVKYDLTGFEKDFKGNEQKELFKNIKVFIKNEKNKIIYETDLKSRKEKFVIRIKEPGQYKVCARYNRPRRGRELNQNILMALKLRPDYNTKDLDNTLKSEDVTHFWAKIADVSKDIRPSIEAAKSELNEEDKTAKSIISSISLYYKLCLIQLAVIICVTAYTLYSYKDFFKKLSLV